MFTGIIEKTGELAGLEKNGSNIVFQIKAPGTAEKLGESIAINGTCLTVIKFDQDYFWVEAIPETLKLTNLGEQKIGNQLNLEKSLQVGASLDGHFVLGHIDFKTTVSAITPDGESEVFEVSQLSSLRPKRIWFDLPDDYQKFVAKKGSICINGVSLTLSDVSTDRFEVCLIPYTLAHTNLGQLTPNSPVNIEIDIVARYLEKQLSYLSK